MTLADRVAVYVLIAVIASLLAWVVIGQRRDRQRDLRRVRRERAKRLRGVS